MGQHDNLWRLEQITTVRRIIDTKVPEVIYGIITARTGGRYLVRSDGLRSSWWPRNSHGENAFVDRAVDVFNQLRVSQRIWFNDRENRAMTRSEVRKAILNDLIREFGNQNLY